MFRFLGAAYRVIVVRGRWVMLLVWVLLAYLALTRIAPLTSGSTFDSLVPPNSPVVQDQMRVQRHFPIPVQSGTTVVLYDPNGLSEESRVQSYQEAVNETKQHSGSIETAEPGTMIAAVPLPMHPRDIAVTYLFWAGGTSPVKAIDGAHQYADRFHNVPSQQTFVTGFVPAQVAQSSYLMRYIHVFEILSLILIVVVVALAFRSVLAPLMVLGMAGFAYVIHQRLMSLIATKYAITIPDELQPVLLALLLGVVTDYCVLMLEDFRARLDHGEDKRPAALAAVKRQAPIILVAALAVAGGTLALLASPLAIFRPLGPAMAFTVGMGALVSLTLAPSVMCILGWTLFAPLPLPRFRRQLRGKSERKGSSWVSGIVRVLTMRGVALLAAFAMLALLVVASMPLRGARLDLSFTAGLPRTDEVARGAALLHDAGIAGSTSPTEILIEQNDVASHRPELAALQQRLATMPGVSNVLGPADMVDKDTYGLVISRDGNAARFIVVFNSDPAGSKAIENVRILQRELPNHVRDAGLTPSYFSVTGQSVIASMIARQTVEAMVITLLVAFAVELLILMLYLRSFLAPIVLVGVSALVVTAALGLTVLLFQRYLHAEGLTFYAPFASAVLLLALGSDYTVFTVGQIWTETESRGMRDSIRVAVPKVARAISIAGAILAATFAVVAVIPLATFWQIAFTMSVGLLIDTYLVRPYLTPSLLALLGRAATWPRKRDRSEPVDEEPGETEQTDSVATQSPGSAGSSAWRR